MHYHFMINHLKPVNQLLRALKAPNKHCKHKSTDHRHYYTFESNMLDPSPVRGYLGNGLNSQKGCVFVFSSSSETG